MLRIKKLPDNSNNRILRCFFSISFSIVKNARQQIAFNGNCYTNVLSIKWILSWYLYIYIQGKFIAFRCRYSCKQFIILLAYLILCNGKKHYTKKGWLNNSNESIRIESKYKLDRIEFDDFDLIWSWLGLCCVHIEPTGIWIYFYWSVFVHCCSTQKMRAALYELPVEKLENAIRKVNLYKYLCHCV